MTRPKVGVAAFAAEYPRLGGGRCAHARGDESCNDRSEAGVHELRPRAGTNLVDKLCAQAHSSYARAGG